MFIYQVNQHELNFCPARSKSCSQLLVVDCRAFVTDLSAFASAWESWRLQDFKSASNFIKTKQWSGRIIIYIDSNQ
jgi:hypothetical protein|tara:strand:+ start:586 stop:813 length:228 start_codon:yes stop_codon:yes gene_type:complete